MSSKHDAHNHDSLVHCHWAGECWDTCAGQAVMPAGRTSVRAS